MSAAAAVRPITAADEPGLLALNNACAAETSLLDAPRLHSMVAMAFMAATVGPAEAMLIAFDQDAAYDSVNFRWFRDRLARFVYVDRVVTAQAARGRGYARLLYRQLFTRAAASGHDRVACEINSEPPNPASDRFHAGLGFEQVGSAVLGRGGKRVRYVSRPLPGPDLL